MSKFFFSVSAFRLTADIVYTYTKCTKLLINISSHNNDAYYCWNAMQN